MRLLALDTSTEACSVALQWDGALFSRYQEVERGHAELILPMIEALLAEANGTLVALDAIAFARGPGSFTGVRLAAGVTQGLAFAAGLPVIPVSTLRVVAQRALMMRPAALAVTVCNDARMGEIYWAHFLRGESGNPVADSPERVSAPEAVQLSASSTPDRKGVRIAAGRGLRAAPQLVAQLQLSADDTLIDLLPDAASLLELATLELEAGRVSGAADAVPVYVRDQVAKLQSA